MSCRVFRWWIPRLLGAGCGICVLAAGTAPDPKSLRAAGSSISESTAARATTPVSSAMEGVASWYGEEHRGKPMANGLPFDPDKFTAASWFFPLGSRVRVTLRSDRPRSVIVVITDRGPAWRFVHQGRVIDLSLAAFRQLTALNRGLASVSVEQTDPPSN